jgi:hypothetical protein
MSSELMLHGSSLIGSSGTNHGIFLLTTIRQTKYDVRNERLSLADNGGNSLPRKKMTKKNTKINY